MPVEIVDLPDIIEVVPLTDDISIDPQPIETEVIENVAVAVTPGPSIPTFIGPDAPTSTPAAYTWWQTFDDGTMTLWVEDGT